MSTRVVEEPSPTRLADKVVASAQGAGAASMFGLVVFWLLETYAHTVVPMPVQIACVGLLSWAVAQGAGWLRTEEHPSPSAVETIDAQRAQGRRPRSPYSEPYNPQ
jgi:hypothetical protein